MLNHGERPVNRPGRGTYSPETNRELESSVTAREDTPVVHPRVAETILAVLAPRTTLSLGGGVTFTTDEVASMLSIDEAEVQDLLESDGYAFVLSADGDLTISVDDVIAFLRERAGQTQAREASNV